MKLGKALIVTLHCCPNYGAVLQAFALSEFLKTIFNNVEVVDYQPTSVMNEYRYINTYSLPSIVMSLFSLPNFIRKRRRFAKFSQSYLTLSPLYIKTEQIKYRDIDCCFLGSDQIWNPEITNGLDPIYFGIFNANDNMKVISYAASLGNNKALSDCKNDFTDYLNRVDSISVREEAAKNFILSIINRPVSVVLDPTLLAGVDVFRQFVRPVKIRVPYLLIYTLNASPDNEIRPLASVIAKKLGLKLIEINGNRNGLKRPKHKVIYDASPETFITLIAHSAYIVTDSFHGTAFSLLFHRPFITLKHKTRGDRMHNLLSKVNLLDRLTSTPTDMQITNQIDWNMVDASLNAEKNQSTNFIKQSIALDSYDRKA